MPLPVPTVARSLTHTRRLRFEAYKRADMAFGLSYFHWFFMTQPFDLPEHLIGADPGYYLKRKIGHWSADKNAFAPEAQGWLRWCFASKDPQRLVEGVDRLRRRLAL